MGRVEQRRYLLGRAESGHGETRRVSSSSFKAPVLFSACKRWIQLLMLSTFIYRPVSKSDGKRSKERARRKAWTATGEVKGKEVAEGISNVEDV